MKRLTLVALCLLAAPMATAQSDYTRTCKYFVGISYNDRHTKAAPTFRVRLADDCGQALAQRAAARPGTVEYVLADHYLTRLEDYRQVLIDMARARFRVARSETTGNRFRPVSETGAYLIARTMGLFENQDRWRARQQAMAEGRVLPQ